MFKSWYLALDLFVPVWKIYVENEDNVQYEKKRQKQRIFTYKTKNLNRIVNIP